MGHVVLIADGKLVSTGALRDLTGPPTTVVSTPVPGVPRTALLASGRSVGVIDRETVEVTGLAASEVGRLAARESVVIFGLTEQHDGLERLFQKLTTQRLLERAS